MIDIALGTAADIPFVMAAERRDGYAAIVGRWDEGRHRAALADDRYAYFVARQDGACVGFAILRDWNSEERVTLLKRIAVTEPGRGLGRTFLAALQDALFTTTPAHRLWLGVYPENLRARRAYAAAGFVEEGITRGSAFFDGDHRDEVMMAILRPDWLRLRREAPA